VPSSRSLPPALAERAREFVARRLPAVRPGPAATVVLLRDADAGIEVYLLRRQTSMAFAGGMQAFPGGAVDPRDADDHVLGWLGSPPAAWAERLGTSVPLARGFVCAAIRETFEESGVLLASAPDGSPITPAGPAWESDRRALVERRLALSDLLERRGLRVRSDVLRPWAHWVTPRFEPRRYDTWFFLAALPAGQHARDVSGEAERAFWTSPGEAISAAEASQAAMLPPTWAVLDELADYSTTADALAAAAGRVIESVTPGWVEVDGEISVVLPGDSAFPGADPGDERAEST
jgi:8-oxo-dGTP pyrophosphatase MutT (NUDIX family)